MKLTLSSFVVLFSVFSLHTSIASEELPLWEVGVGVGGLSQSYYTGTKQKRRFAFPVIVPVYRGEIIKSDDKGMRAELFNNNKLKLEASLDFNLSTALCMHLLVATLVIELHRALFQKTINACLFFSFVMKTSIMPFLKTHH